MKINKLVRDQVPLIIVEAGKQAVCKQVEGDEYIEALKNKLSEEVEEFCKDEAVEEMADILELLYTFCEIKGVDWAQLEKLRIIKAEKRGRFKKHIFLEEVIE